MAMSQNGPASAAPHPEDATADTHLCSERNLSGWLEFCVLLRHGTSADCSIALLPVDRIDNVPKLSSLFSPSLLIVDGRYHPYAVWLSISAGLANSRWMERVEILAAE